jgi:hypothetical protein
VKTITGGIAQRDVEQIQLQLERNRGVSFVGDFFFFHEIIKPRVDTLSALLTRTFLNPLCPTIR